jgi:hypothetical protein
MELLELIGNHIRSNIIYSGDIASVFGNHYPDSPDTVISIIDSGGFPPNKYSPIREKIFDVKIRTQNYSYGIDLGNQIFKLFHSKNKFYLGDFFILQSYAYTELSYLFKDDKERHQFSIEIVFQYKN